MPRDYSIETSIVGNARSVSSTSRDPYPFVWNSRSNVLRRVTEESTAEYTRTRSRWNADAWGMRNANSFALGVRVSIFRVLRRRAR